MKYFREFREFDLKSSNLGFKFVLAKLRMYNFEFSKKMVRWVFFRALKSAFFGLYGENGRI